MLLFPRSPWSCAEPPSEVEIAVRSVVGNLSAGARRSLTVAAKRTGSCCATLPPLSLAAATRRSPSVTFRPEAARPSRPSPRGEGGQPVGSLDLKVGFVAADAPGTGRPRYRSRALPPPRRPALQPQLPGGSPPGVPVLQRAMRGKSGADGEVFHEQRGERAIGGKPTRGRVDLPRNDRDSGRTALRRPPPIGSDRPDTARRRAARRGWAASPRSGWRSRSEPGWPSCRPARSCHTRWPASRPPPGCPADRRCRRRTPVRAGGSLRSAAR